MKPLWLNLLIRVVSFMWISGVYIVGEASSVGLLEEGKFTLGGEVTWVRDRDMYETETAKVSSDQYLAVLKYGLSDRIMLAGKFGVANLETHMAEGETTFFDIGFAYGLGLKGLLYDGDFRIILGGQYFTFKPESGGETTGVMKHAYSSGGDVEIEWEEWQGEIAIEKDVEDVVLYGGMKYSNLDCFQVRKFSTSEIDSTFREQRNVGLFCGFCVPFGERFKTNFEVNLLDETAFTVKLSWTL